MADRIPQQPTPSDESKKDTVRINLPPGVGKGTAPGSPPTVKLRPAGAPVSPAEEAKQETAVMGRPVAAPQSKSDTSRVAVPAAKPSVPETPRPTVKLRREEPVPAAPSVAVVPVAAAAPVVAPVAAPSGLDTGLALAAMAVSVLVLAYLALVALG